MALDFAAGCLGGCAGVLVGHPFDTVKVHLQTQDFRNPTYRGTFHCLKTIFIKDSVRGLYRGLSSPMAGVAFVNAIVFGVYGNVQRHMNEPDSLKAHFVAGSLAGFAQSFICSPMELAKTRLQLQANSAVQAHKGPLQCLNSIWKKEGMRGVFRGLGVTILRDIPGMSSYFISYELMTRDYNPSAFHTLMAGGLAGTFSWIVTFPIDIIKSRLQADGMSGKLKYSGMVDCVRQSYREEGLKFLSRGLTSTLLRAFPMNAACFLVVSYTLRLSRSSDLNVRVYNEPLHMVGSSSSAPIIIPRRHFQHSKTHKLSHTTRSLIFLGAFSEAVCANEIMDMTSEEHHDGDDDETYYKVDVTETEKIILSNGTDTLKLLKSE